MLTESNIAECQAKFNLSYHVTFARICQDLVGFEGKDVLEVGGSLPQEFVFDYLHVKSWSAIETPDYEESLKEAGGLSHTGTIIPNIKDTSNLGFDNRKLEKYNFFLENIENLPQEYYGKYDLIFSIATFEHIHKLPAALDKMFMALKPGGKLFSMFSPIWSAYDGHHLPKITDRAGKVFDFGNSPIPPWGHLLMKADELCHYLYQYTDKETAELIVDYVYNSPHINRYFTEDYLEFIKASKFSSKQVELIFENPIDEKTKENLERLYPGKKKFNNNGMLVVLEKNTKEGREMYRDKIKLVTEQLQETAMSTLSVCMMVQNAEKTLAIALESLDGVYDELIIVDGGSHDKTCEIAASYGAKIIHSPWSGNHSQQRNVYLKEVKTDWVFVLDSDEFIDIKTCNFLRQLCQSKESLNVDNFWIPRKWISPFNIKQYISSPPHFPDGQRRVFKFNKNLSYSGYIHEVLTGLNSSGICEDLSIYHLDLFINDEQERQNKVRKYMKLEPTNGGIHFYLPNPRELQFQDWDQEISLTKKTNNLLESLVKSYKQNSQLNQIIPAEIKDDEFYMTIQEIASKATIKTILEIGSSSGGGSTEAFVKGIRENPHKPTLFCLEVSQPRFVELQQTYSQESFVKCYNLSSVSIKDFPTENQVLIFYQQIPTNLNNYSAKTIIGWLNQDIEYVLTSGVTQNGIEVVKKENQIEFFDVVLIDGSEFTGNAELAQVYGSKIIMLDDINTFKNYHNYQILTKDKTYDLVAENKLVRNGYAIFQRNKSYNEINCDRFKQSNDELPIHFFTIVLNGEPFIRYHIDVLKQLPFTWHWHIIEGVAQLKHDTAWSLAVGGVITDGMHNKGRSNDGTSEYLDELAKAYPYNITIYRKPEGEFWEGKREMVNEPLITNIREECLLWQIDVDEIWSVEQICNAQKAFIENPEKTAAFYWCWYFVGDNLIISTRNCYAQNPKQDWLRTWRFKPGCLWIAHEPPVLAAPLPTGKWVNVAEINPFLHAETEREGLIFQHFAYVTPEQLRFKEQYYGYQNAVSQWQSLQSQTKFPVYLRDYFAWVGDNTMVDRAESLGIVPLVQKDITRNNWKFLQPEYLQQPVKMEKRSPTIIIDGIFFQLSSTGIARLWGSVLGEWGKTEFAQHLIVLDRVNTSPKIPGIRYRQIPAYNYNNTDADKQMLQKVCDEEGADLFISTYYTTPISTPSVFMAYDMIPEALETDLNKAMWREKHHAISHGFSYISISENTARDLVKFFPDITPDEVTVACCGVAPTFTPATTTEINGFKYKYGISKPYFLLVGAGSNYKNAILFFQAFAQLYSKQGFEIVCTGSGLNFANEYREYAAGSVLHSLILSDEELKVAYSGAVALVYPSLYEGFGMPVAEALACGCPVITCANSSIPEVAGEAAIYVDANDVDGLTDALCEVQKPKVRNSLIAAGLEQVKQFSWEKMADIMSAALMKATLQRLNLREINLIIFPDWSQPEETVGLELQEVIKNLVTHPDRGKMTLLIDNSNISAEDADLILSSVAMNLLMESELEVDEGPEIVLLGELSQIQWSALIVQLQGRIKLEHENGEAMTVVDENIPVYEIQGIERLRAISLETGGWELFKLSEINLIIFPDWSQPEETVGLELQEVIKNLVTHPDRGKMTLLIDNSNISAEDADLILSSVAMNLLMESELEVDEGPEIVLLGELSQIQWSALIAQLQGRIKLEHENEEVKIQVKADSIPSIAVDSLQEKLDWINLSSKQIIPKQDNFEKQPINQIKSESLTEKDEAEKILSELEILEKGTTENGQPIGFFRQIGDVESYYEQTQKVVNDIHSFIFQNPDNKTAHQIAKWFTLKAKLFLYFSQANLKDIYKKRAEIIEFALKIEGYQVEYNFPERTGDRRKIRLGIIANNFEPHPETFATLPVYKHLNREEFEIILYYLQASGHPLERYCYEYADAAIELPEDLELQVKAVRKNDLDILFISTNITSQTNAITLLASHRLARIQIVGMNSPVTTGMRHIDCYISSKLTDSETNAKEHYTEKLVTLDGPDQCFDFATEKELSVTTTISRKELNIDENTVVYISGANFYKIIPEVEATWVQIIAQVPNSMLLLYPFNPNWAPTYPIEVFQERFLATLSKYGVSEKRLLLLNALPNRADIKECLKLANIYLDAYPFSGMTSLIDPLQICLPTVVMQKESARSRRGASLLRYLEIPELIADSEDTYIQLAVDLGINSDLRAVYRDRIETKMEANPQFLDSRYYSSQMGYLFQKVFQEYLASDN